MFGESSVEVFSVKARKNRTIKAAMKFYTDRRRNYL
jgi:hypothetical protein